MKRVRCFFLEPTDQVEMLLRRYRSEHGDSPRPQATCPLEHGYHDASVVIGRVHASACPELHDGRPVSGDVWPHDDPRWPARCACGYTFAAEDSWQFNPDRLYRRLDTGELMLLALAPRSAMSGADWMRDVKQREYKGPGSWIGPDGLSLYVRTPGGDWFVDGPASNGQGWTREGKIPDITARPSILVPSAKIGPARYHGFLTAGWLEEC